MTRENGCSNTPDHQKHHRKANSVRRVFTAVMMGFEFWHYKCWSQQPAVVAEAAAPPPPAVTAVAVDVGGRGDCNSSGSVVWSCWLEMGSTLMLQKQ